MLRIVHLLMSHWRGILPFLAPLLLLPLVTISGEGKCAFLILLMAVFWVTECIPLPVTALLPIVLLPLLGIMTTEEVCVTYFKESNMMFIGSLMVAISVEMCGLHRRIALKALLRIGTSPRLLVLGFMLPTAFLSMWISNTATTSMMVPIVEGVLLELEQQMEREGEANTKIKSKVRVMLYLAVAYSANMGGVSTLTGTGPNLVFKGMVSTLFGTSTPINFASWMGFALPTVMVNLLILWCWLQIYFIGFPGLKKSSFSIGDQDGIRKMLLKKYEDLGKVTFRQKAVLCLFSILVLLWFFREPRFITGWGDFWIEETDGKVHQIVDDASSAMLIVFLMFIIPSELCFWPFVPISESKFAPSLLSWPELQKRFPWGIALLFGGGFALAKASKVSGLSGWVGCQLGMISSLPSWCVVLVVCVITAAITEITSNVATANILLPVLAEVASATHTNPLFLMVPATVSCSYAFMLPVATPPNAIAHEASGMKTTQMMLVGFVLNITCLMVNMLAVNTYGVKMFGLDEFPSWANNSVSVTNCIS